MKRVSGLYEKIADIENLRLADKKARKGKLRSYGVQKHDMNKEENLQYLHNLLIKKRYKTSEYHVFKIYEPKEREIYQLPYFPDRIVHHAVMNILEPIWISLFISGTYSCIKGRGIHKAKLDIERALRDKDGTTYCLKLDIAKFYPTIDHDALKCIVRKKIKDKDLLALLDGIINSAEGVPIGNYLSQYFANLYLTYFDHWVKEKKGVQYYFRYADDIIIFHHEKEYLHKLRANIEEYLRDELSLSLKKQSDGKEVKKYQIFPIGARGVDFLGYKFFHTHTFLRKSIKKNLCKKANKVNKLPLLGCEYRRKLCGNIGWAIHCNSKNLLNKIIKRELYEDLFKRKTSSDRNCA